MILAFVAWFAVLALAELRTATRREDLNHPGSESDQRLITNFGLAALILAIGAAFPLAMMGAALAGNQLSLGLSHRMPIPWLVVLAAALLAQTFVSYWIHRWMHRTTFLWRFHRVHHADSSVDVSTSLRNHPLELAVQMPASAMVIVALGAPATAVIAMQVVLLFNKVWEHADVSLPEKIERRLSRVIFTPALHRLHHSPERSLHDSNYGELFILWDYLFGTLNRRSGRGPVGLEAQVARPDRLIDQLCSPLYAL